MNIKNLFDKFKKRSPFEKEKPKKWGGDEDPDNPFGELVPVPEKPPVLSPGDEREPSQSKPKELHGGRGRHR